MLTPFGFDFRTGKQGLEKVLGPLESEIMDLVWAKGRVTVREIYESILANTDKSIAYTTVMTTMSRLAKKDILNAFKEGNAYSYEAACPKEKFLSTVIGEVVDGLIDDFSEPAVAHFIEKIKSVDPVKLKQLEDLIRAQKKDEY